MLKPRREFSERPATFREHAGALILLLPFLVGLVLAFIFGNVVGAVFWILMTCVGSDRLVVNIAMRSIIYLILIAILFPVFSQARARAKTKVCLSNVKQVTQNTLLYAQDYDGVFPDNEATFTTSVSPDLKTRALLTCPAAPQGTISYTFNSNLAGVSTHTVTSPDRTFLIYEGLAGKLNFRHEDRAVIGFADGSCKLIRPNQTTSLIWTVQAPTKK